MVLTIYYISCIRIIPFNQSDNPHESLIFLFKSLLFVVFLLIVNISFYSMQPIKANRQSSVPYLP